MPPRGERRSVRLDRDGCPTNIVSVAATTAGTADRRTRGKVKVHDFVRHRTVLGEAGENRVVRASRS
jgi:hypothetical protein